MIHLSYIYSRCEFFFQESDFSMNIKIEQTVDTVFELQCLIKRLCKLIESFSNAYVVQKLKTELDKSKGILINSNILKRLTILLKLPMTCKDKYMKTNVKHSINMKTNVKHSIVCLET